MSKDKMNLKEVTAMNADSKWTKDDGYISKLTFYDTKDRLVSIVLTRNQLVAVRDILAEILYEMAKDAAGPDGFVITDDLDNSPDFKR